MQQFSRDGFTFDVTDERPADGPVVVLLHGFPENRTSLGAADAAARRGRLPRPRAGPARLLARRPPDGRRSYAMPELVADVLALSTQPAPSGCTSSVMTGAAESRGRSLMRIPIGCTR